jgi:hypothetical protein
MKLFAVSATMLTSITVASVSLADDASTVPSGSASTTTSATVTTPSAPATSATQTTTTTLQPGSAPAAATSTAPASGSQPTSTTTTTSAEAMMAPPSVPREEDSVTVYRNRRPNTALLITGTSLLVSTYATTAAIQAGTGREGVDDHLYIPIAGPWINLANEQHETRDNLLIAGSGVLQGVGAALFITSFFVPSKVEAARIHAGPVNFHVAPTTARGGAGLGAIGTF